MQIKDLSTTEIDNKIICFHCGEECKSTDIAIGDKYFCCNGCKTVYEMLEQNDLCNYYQIENNPGITKNNNKRNFEFLDNDTIKEKLILFKNNNFSSTTLYIPQMHCSSCIWILENLSKLNSGIIFSEVDFLKKTCSVRFNEELITLKSVVELLDSLGYTPLFNLDNNAGQNQKGYKSLYYKLGVAGFCFGNIMLLSFPEYFSLTGFETDNLKTIFAYLNLILSIPVIIFSSSEYYISAYKGITKGIVNIDFPITLGIIVLFFRSIFDLFMGFGPGYFDSLSGLVFLLLVGKLFQNKTYDTLNFERNYKSYFPLASTKIDHGVETPVPLELLQIKDQILIHNNELIPADSVLKKGKGNIDYSFVTGESIPIIQKVGDVIFAGGKQIGSNIVVEIVREISQSYLTQLWNHKSFTDKFHSQINNLTNKISKSFTFYVLAIAAIASVLHYNNLNMAFNIFTAVLIVACPCALALAAPFTLGNTLRIFGKNKFYLKNADVVEKLSQITSIVFDKTGTLTKNSQFNVNFVGNPLTTHELQLIKSTTKSSYHPFSQSISSSISGNINFEISEYDEISGSGITAKIEDDLIKVGSASFIGYLPPSDNDNTILSSKVYVSINNIYKGYYTFTNFYRNGIENLIKSLSNKLKLFVLSGDNESERDNLNIVFQNKATIKFNQSPFNKLEFIEELQKSNETVLMIGDGLNDAGALKQSNIGITVSEDINNFYPACDGILDANYLTKLKDFLNFSKFSKNIIIISFIISLFYNIIGLGFAVTGSLSPLVAAVLMPVSSISVVVFTTFSVNLYAKRKGFL
ncbi:MAG: heavy metal translocating P-type ATPase metal-binding domain-containing protein [bacterium]